MDRLDAPAVRSEKPCITSITLGGFQVFDEPTTVPLGKLTLLFGPNSAGKSAIEDGLDAILRILRNESIFGIALPDELRRHWRNSEQRLAPSLTMGITATIPTNVRASLDVPNEDGGSDYPTFGHEVGLNFWLTYDDEYDEISSRGRFVLSINGVPILELHEGEHLGVNFSHPMLRGFILVGNYESLALQIPTIVSLRDGWVLISSLFCCFQSEEIKFSTMWGGMEAAARELGAGSFRPFEGQPFEAMLRTAIEEILAFYDEIKGVCIGNIHITPDVVPASRKIPSNRELTFLCNADEALDDLELVRDSATQYRRLAYSCLAKRTYADKYYVGMGRVTASLLDSVNAALSGHLFLERGYAVSADIRVIVPFEDIGCLPDGIHSDIACLVHVHLTDSQSRKQVFDQVGSGLGYVLPILCSVCDSNVAISFLQQPELHLHPALQAAMGDVLIEHAADEHQIIVETHSEHLLLRILKRIRQTSQGKAPACELALHPEDVVVVYFDPKPDGTTTVKRLRISEDGEFLDRWPRGFFTERDSELFDE